MTRTNTSGRKQPRKPPPAKPDHDPRPSQAAEPPGAIRVRAQSPAALLAIIPYLLGFTPENSLVVVGYQPPKGEIRVSMRYDLPRAGETDLIADIAAHAIAVVAAERQAGAIAIGYGPDSRVRPLIEVLGEVAAGKNVELTECLRVQDGRYWSYLCRDERCCPEDGIAFDAAGHPAAAAMAAASRAALASRSALAASIAPIGGIAAESMLQATRRAERHVTQVLAKVRKSHRIGAARHMIASEGLATVSRLIGAYRAGEKYRSDYELAWLTVALRDIRVRDDAWARMDPRFRDEHRRLWIDVVRRARPGYVAAPASLLAFVAWQDGNGALANVALDRALADDREYSMAALLRDVIAAGTPPEMARLPMTPEEVAAEYEAQARDADSGLGETAAEVTPTACDAQVPAMTGRASLR